VDILSGTAVTITGTITEISALPGPDEVKINTGTEVVTVCGLGPAEYWTSLGFTRPVVGDVVTVDGYNVTLSDGSQKIFSAKVTVGSNQVQLIDTTTGKPLFQPKGEGPGHGPIDILSGTAVTITGTITEISALPGPDEVKINTGTEVVTVCGLGPAEYWTSLGFTRPVVGDVVTVGGYKVTLSDGSQKIFSATITVGSNQVQLIDAATGRPLWMGGKGNRT
jgi:tRNA A37 threonylcarbamoyladenosine dehydratase